MADDTLARKRQRLTASETKLKKAISEYKALLNFESLPILTIEEGPVSEGGSTLTPFLSPQESISTLTAPINSSENNWNVRDEEWKGNAFAILDALDQFRLLLKPSREGERLPLKPSAPSSLDSLRDKVSVGLIGSLGEFKIAAGFIIFASSLHLTVDEIQERERLVSLFHKLC